jgi:acyl-homoserine-lactone acylase
MRLSPSLSLLCSIGFITLLLQACAISTPDTHDVSASDDTVALARNTEYHVVIRRTALGIPHIKADNWSSLGYGYGYAQAQDNLCTLADGFVTWRGERSRYFGASARPDTSATFGQPNNLDADFFFRFVDDANAVRHYQDSQTPNIRALVEGFAAGYNRYVGEIQGGAAPGRHLACRSAPWVGAKSPPHRLCQSHRHRHCTPNASHPPRTSLSRRPGNHAIRGLGRAIGGRSVA